MDQLDVMQRHFTGIENAIDGLVAAHLDGDLLTDGVLARVLQTQLDELAQETPYSSLKVLLGLMLLLTVQVLPLNVSARLSQLEPFSSSPTAMQLDELAADKVWEFAFFGACIKLRGATGAPMRPVAMPLVDSPVI